MQVVAELSALKDEVKTLKDIMPKTKRKEKTEKKEADNENIKCFFCGKHYSHQRYLTRHMNMKHKAKLITVRDADTNVEKPHEEENVSEEKTEKKTADNNNAVKNKITEMKKHTGDETAAILIDNSEDENSANFEMEIEEDETSEEEDETSEEEDLEPSRDFFIDTTDDTDYKLKLALNRFDMQNYNNKEVAFSLADVDRNLFHTFTPQCVCDTLTPPMEKKCENNETDIEENNEETALTLTLRDVERYRSLKNIFSKSYHKEEEIQPVDKQNSFTFTNADNDDADDENIEDVNEDEEESNDETIFAHEKMNYSIYGIPAPSIYSDSDSN